MVPRQARREEPDPARAEGRGARPHPSYDRPRPSDPRRGDRDRSHLRRSGPEEACVPRTRSRGSEGRDPCVEHIRLADYQHGAGHEASPQGRRDALLQPADAHAVGRSDPGRHDGRRDLGGGRRSGEVPGKDGRRREEGRPGLHHDPGPRPVFRGGRVDPRYGARPDRDDRRRDALPGGVPDGTVRARGPGRHRCAASPDQERQSTGPAERPDPDRREEIRAQGRRRVLFVQGRSADPEARDGERIRSDPHPRANDQRGGGTRRPRRREPRRDRRGDAARHGVSRRTSGDGRQGGGRHGPLRPPRSSAVETRRDPIGDGGARGPRGQVRKGILPTPNGARDDGAGHSLDRERSGDARGDDHDQPRRPSEHPHAGVLRRPRSGSRRITSR